MLKLKMIIYFICFFIFMHFVLHFFDIDIFDLFEKKPHFEPKESSVVENSQEVPAPNEISDTITDLEKSIQELKDVSSI